MYVGYSFPTLTLTPIPNPLYPVIYIVMCMRFVILIKLMLTNMY